VNRDIKIRLWELSQKNGTVPIEKTAENILIHQIVYENLSRLNSMLRRDAGEYSILVLFDLCRLNTKNHSYEKKGYSLYGNFPNLTAPNNGLFAAVGCEG
jgi:hypothetical protein